MGFFHRWLKGGHIGQRGRYSNLKVALVADALTDAGLGAECNVRRLTPSNYRTVLRRWRPDIVFVESAWAGWRNAWKYKIASYTDHPERTTRDIAMVVAEAADLGIPAVFWNKEDSVHYDRFINTASFFQYIFTVDSNCIPKYQSDIPGCKVGTLMFPIQPRFHYLDDKTDCATGFSCFIGSYSSHIHPRRRQWQHLLFESAARYGLDIYDRNYKRKAAHYRYPAISGMRIHKAVPYAKTAEIYRSYRVNLNVNTIEDSPTMYSRRLIEILAVGGVAISTPSLAVSRLFSDYCYVVATADELNGAIDSIAGAEYLMAKERAREGAQQVSRDHTWERRLEHLEASRIF